MVQEIEVIEIDIDGRTFWVRPFGSWVLQSNNVVAEGLAVSLKQENSLNRGGLLAQIAFLGI